MSHLVDLKVTANVVAGALVSILLAVAMLFGYEVSEAAAAGLITLTALAVGSLVPNIDGYIVSVKGQSATIASALVTVGVYVGSEFNFDAPAPLVAGVATLIAAGVAYAKRETQSTPHLDS